MGKNIITSGCITLIKLYRFAFSALLGPVCRFEPSCSHYATEALRLHGFYQGGCLTIKRLLRCHPWHPGGLDTVPKNFNRRQSSQTTQP